MNSRLAAAVLRVAGVGRTAARLELDPATVSALRRRVALTDPLTFAVTYLDRHLRDADGNLSLSEVHEQWIDYALTWGQPAAPGQERDAFVAPREMGKSTWHFLLLPLWAAAAGRVAFAAAFADSAAQAETHLSTFKRELDENTRLREDFPDLCAPAVRPRGSTVADNRAMLQTAAGFVFAARGIDSGNLGMKVGARRPDLIILDDVEPGESNYSAYQVEKRLSTITDVVLPLNVVARVALVGTVTMPGSIVHQLVQHGAREADHRWVADHGFRVHHALPTVVDETGTERSVWPEKWPLDFLRSIEHTRSYAKNYLNRPVATDGAYWRPEVFVRGDAPTPRQLLSIDPAVTTKTTSDDTGLAVVGHDPAGQQCVVRYARGFKVTGAALRAKVLQLLADFPDTTAVLIETNQGGEVWADVLHDLPVPLKVVHNTDPKEVRAGRLLAHYERGRVLHAAPLVEAEQQLAAFPKAPHDDVVDAIGNAVNRLLAPRKKPQRATARSVSYA